MSDGSGGVAQFGTSPMPSHARFAGLAGPVAVHARPLLTAAPALLLSLTVMPASPGRPVVMGWHSSAVPFALCTILDLDAAEVCLRLTAFEESGARLVDCLVRCWPSNALPPAVGIVTDGIGVVFSPDHPSPMSPAWLMRHQTDQCPTAVLLPFSSSSAWTRLTSRPIDARVH